MEGDSSSLIQDLQNLCLFNKSTPNTKKTQDYCTNLALQESTSDPLIAAVTTDCSIHLMPKSRLTSTSVIKGHEKPVSGIQFGRCSPNLLYSCSLDGTLRCWDTRGSTSKEVQQFKKSETVDVGLLSVDISNSDRVLCAGSEKDKFDAYILFWDSRQENVLGCYSECHQDDITQINFQPRSDQILAAASSDGLLCSYDIAETCEEDAIQLTVNAEADVAKLGWCGDEQKSCLYCVTTDNSFFFWDSTEGECFCNIPDVESLKPSGSKCCPEYVLDCIPDLTGIANKSSAVLVSGMYSGDLSLVSYREGDVYVLSSLSKGHTTPVRCSLWDSKSRTLLTGGEDGLVCVWNPETPSSLQDSTALGKAPAQNTMSKIKDQRKARANDRPYKRTPKTH